MKGELKVMIELSAGAVKAKLEKIINESTKKLKTSIKINSVKSKWLTITIKDENPHQTLLRLRNLLSPKLGKELKIGWRGFKIIDYEIEFKIKEKPKSKFKVPFVKEIEFEDDEVELKIDPKISEDLIEKGAVDRIIRVIKTKIHAQHVTGKAATERVIRESPKRLKDYVYQKDPTQDILNYGWAKEFPTPGIWIIMPPLAALMRGIQKLIINEIAKPMGFSEVILPKAIPLDVMKRKGTLGGIPYEHFFVCPPKGRDPKAFEYYKDWVEITNQSSPELLKKYLGDPMFGLAHGQCEPFYELFKQEMVDLDKLPIKLYDASGPSWRYEAGGLKGLERLNEFHRIEFVYIGAKQDLIKIRDEILKKSEWVLNDIFKMEYRVDANIPVYLEHAGIEEEKEADFVKTYDLTVKLPFVTASKPEAELEISSFHVHTDFYTKRFGTKERHNQEVWTGCSGIAPTRWAFVFLVRWGLDPSKWPEAIKKYTGPIPKVPEMITWPKKKKKD